MTKKSGHRLIIHAISIALMVQGLTPDVHTLVSPLLLHRLFHTVEQGGPDVCHGRMPEKDRPAPSNNDDDRAPDEIVVVGEHGATTLVRRRIADAVGLAMGSTNPSDHSAAPRLLLWGRSAVPPCRSATSPPCSAA